jgi:hypothetical protein
MFLSKSYRKNDFSSNTCKGFDCSEKEEKILAHKTMRRKSKNILNNIYDYLDEDEEIELPTLRNISNVCNWKKDGKQNFSNLKHEDPETYRKLKNK